MSLPLPILTTQETQSHVALAFIAKTMNHILQRAMYNSDELVVELDYTDSKGIRTHRVVSPIRFLPGGRFLGFCLCREEPRQFHLNRCSNVTLHRAENYLMPMAMAPVAESVGV